MFLQMAKRRFLTVLGADAFSDDLIRLSVVQTFFIFATTLSDVFISVFLYKSNGNDFVLVAKFQLIKYILEELAFLAAPHLIKRANVLTCMKLGIGFYIAAYVALLSLQSGARDYFAFISLLVGCGSAFYWIGYQTLTKRYTTLENRQAAFGYLSLISNAIATIAPTASGFITSRLVGILGYLVIFAVSAAAFAATAFFSRKLTAQEGERLEVHTMALLRSIAAYAGARRVMIGELLRGIRDGMVLYYLNVLVYYASSSELAVGLCLAAKNALMILAYAYVKRLPDGKARGRTTIIAGAVEFVFLCVMFATGLANGKISSIMILIYSILYVWFYVLAFNHGSLSVYDAMEWAGRKRNTDYEMVAIRQGFCAVGRVAAVALLLLLPDNPIYGTLVLLFGAAASMAGARLHETGSEQVIQDLKTEAVI